MGKRKASEVDTDDNDLRKPKSRSKANQSDDEMPDIIVNDPTNKENRLHKSTKPKSKAKLVEYTVSQLNALNALIKENISPYTNEIVGKTKTILDSLNSDNCKISMLLART